MTIANPLTAVSVDALRKRTSAKWRRYPADVLPVWVAEMDVDLAAPIRAALENLVSRSDTGYAAPSELAEAFVDFAHARWAWPDLKTSHVAPVASVIQGYTDALLQVTGGTGSVVVTPPVYPPFYSYLREAGLAVVEAPLRDLRLDFAAIEAALAQAASAGPVAFLLCNPHNPGGTLHTRFELEQLAQIAHAHGAAVVSDEIHAPIVYPGGEFVPYLSVPGGERGFALHAASKAWNLAAIPAALLVAGADAGADLTAFRRGAHHSPTHFGAVAQVAAYRDGGPWLDALLVGLDSNRHLAADLIERHLPVANYHMPEATFLTWIDCTGLGMGEDPAATFLDKGRVALNSGPTFGTGGAGHVRLNIATHPDIITEAVLRMAACVGS